MAKATIQTDNIVTTIDFPRDLHVKAKIAAVRRGVSLRALVNLAVTSYLAKPAVT